MHLILEQLHFFFSSHFSEVRVMKGFCKKKKRRENLVVSSQALVGKYNYGLYHCMFSQNILGLKKQKTFEHPIFSVDKKRFLASLFGSCLNDLSADSLSRCFFLFCKAV